MTTEDPLKNWQLENREQDAEQWKLQETEQDLSKHMQLQPGQPDPYWQPIEYTRNPPARGRNWVLPSVLIVALLAVLGYVGWTAYGQVSSGAGLDLAGLIPGMGEAAATATPTDAPAAVLTEEATPTLEPTATSAPLETPTPTIEPTPTIAMAQLSRGTVNAVGGVNARREAAITGELVELLNEGAQVVVTRQDGEWSQVILPNGTTVAWVAAEFLDVTTQPVPLAELAALYTTAGLPVPTPAAPAALLPAPTPAAGAEITGTAPLTGSLLGGGPPDLVPNGVIPDVPFTNTLPLVGPALTVTDTNGVNARSAPDATGNNIIVTVPNGAVLPVTGRNPAGDWLQVPLPTGETGWMFADAVVASPDAQSAPVVTAATTSLTDTAAEATPAAPPVAANAPDGATATVSNDLGANLRPAPSRDVDGVYTAAVNESFALVGRSGDGEWVQVILPDGSSAWALLTTVSLSVDFDALPVTQP